MEFQFTEPSKKLACFDLDFTLIKPKNGKQFPTNISDWEYAYGNVLQVVTKLHDLGWKIVIFTNQKKTKTSLSFEDLIKKLEKVLPFTPDVYMSNSGDYFRKPMKGMWDEFITLNGEPEVAFYVGDAAGRDSDHSDADRRFAYNIGIPYYLPEEIFDNDTFDAETFVPVIHTHETLKDIPIIPKFPKPIDPLPKLLPFITGKNAVIIMTGRPASGKSFLSRQIKDLVPDSIIVSNDITGSSAKSRKLFKESLANNVALIILDNTSPSRSTRAEYIAMIPSTYVVVSLYAYLPEECCIILDEMRAYENKSTTIPTLVYRMYKSKYEGPNKKEGFHLLLNYIPDITSDKIHKVMANHFTWQLTDQ